MQITTYDHHISDVDREKERGHSIDQNKRRRKCDFLSLLYTCVISLFAADNKVTFDVRLGRSLGPIVFLTFKSGVFRLAGDDDDVGGGGGGDGEEEEVFLH